MTVVRNVQLPVSDGSELFVELRMPPSAKSVLVVCHGICEHSGRYGRLIERLTEQGIASVRFDLRGHGNSTGRRGHVDRFELYVEDLHHVILWTKSHCRCGERSLPTFLFGHSMGGVIVSRYLQHYGSWECHGVVLSAPGFSSQVEIPAYKRALLRLLLPCLPKLRLPTGITADQLTSDLEEQSRYRADGQIGSRVSLRWYVEFTRESALALERASEVTLPIYGFCGTSDRVVMPTAVREFVERAQSKDKYLRFWDGLRHEPLNERLPERSEVAQSIAEWISSRSDGIQPVDE